MNDGYSLAGIILFALFVIIDACVFGFEVAFSNLSEGEIAKNRDEGDKKAEKILELMADKQRFDCTILVAAVITNTVTGVFIVNHFATFYNNAWITAAICIGIMCFVAVFGIIVPTKIATLKSKEFVYKAFPVTKAIVLLLLPIIVIVTFVSNCILRLFGMNPNPDNDNVTEEEILTMVNEGHEQGVIEAEEAEMISNIFEYGDKEAMDIMTHRKNIVAVDGNFTLEEAVNFMLHENNSRYPVYDEDIDNIVGIVHIKDALKEYGNQVKSEELIKNIDSLLYKPELVPETRNINDLFKFMQQEKTHMVIVVDEYGQTAGIVTMEDILEEIVGNILDEHDEEEEQILHQDDNTYVVDGMALLEDIEEELNISFELEDINTLNGFMTLKLGKVASEDIIGEKVSFKDYEFEVLEVDGKVISLVSIKKEIKDNSDVLDGEDEKVD